MIEQWKNYSLYIQKNPNKIKTIISNCSDNLQIIKAKIAN